MWSLSDGDTAVGDFCDDNVCACAVSALILLPVVNISPKMDSETSMTGKF